ncbi:hypothetical protein K450DRAFT_248584 [Umbelopsis ramanniana AG]|uniref:Uncharacterized protein n=1 Tax=Umbelopsis ramanniana AG TaxID=1314678 RepID=A0AAD5HBM8_UMBRA|nr:uncharacterized protein K450DRAFT_248584 [Umbelopsis ramanniana AG]KAI8578192.1 hypothetical protein K450DRAFT_248584 [Umbelopsis ramanniana AG]
MSKIQFDNGVMILSAVDPLSNRMSIQILQLPHPPKLEPLDFLFEPTANSRKRVRPSKETRAIVERELMLVRANSKFTEHFIPPPTTPITPTRPLSSSSFESALTSSEGTTCSRSTRRRRPSLGLVQRLFASSDPEPEPLEVSWLDADICDSKHTASKKFPILKGNRHVRLIVVWNVQHNTHMGSSVDLLMTTKRIRRTKSCTAPDQYASSPFRTTSWWSEAPMPSMPLVK